MTEVLIGVVVIAVLLVGTVLGVLSRYKTCPSNRVLVKYGRVAEGLSAVPIHGGATFVWPVFQGFAFLDLTPITTDIPLTSALSKQNIRVNVPSRFTIGIGTTPELMTNAAERLLGLPQMEIEEKAREIIFGQLRATIATMDIEDINADRETFEKKVMDNIEFELQKIGLTLINVNISDITDESGYIEALGEKAAAEAINRAKVQVAEQTREGEIGKANALQEQRVKVASANATAVQGENEAKVIEAQSHAKRREAEAEASRLGDAAEAVKRAASQEEGYQAEQKAERARAERKRATQHADVVVPAEIAKQELVIRAEADKERSVLEGQGRGEARSAELAGEGSGLYAVLAKKADGFKKLVESAGGDPKLAAMLMVVEQLPEVVQAQADAISGIQFDKVVVMDEIGSDGTSTTANWLASLPKVLPGLHEMAQMAGVKLPDLLGQMLNERTTGAAGGSEASIAPADHGGDTAAPES
jgi:flotillin